MSFPVVQTAKIITAGLFFAGSMALCFLATLRYSVRGRRRLAASGLSQRCDLPALAHRPPLRRCSRLGLTPSLVRRGTRGWRRALLWLVWLERRLPLLSFTTSSSGRLGPWTMPQ
jgi:hypothetical protein